MKKAANILISTLLLLSIILSFSSCHYLEALLNKNVPTTTPTEQTTPADEQKRPSFNREDHYSAGLTTRRSFHDEYGVYWFETYEEVLEAMELLKSHGSQIYRTVGFNYESDFMDSKFFFIYPKKYAEPLEEGKRFLDRRIDGGCFVWYGFTRDVTIDEFLYDSTRHSYVIFGIHSITREDFRLRTDIEDVNKLYFRWFGKDDLGLENPMNANPYYLFYEDVFICELEHALLLPPEIHDEFARSFVIFE